MAKEHDSLKVGAVTIAVIVAFFVLLLWISGGVSGSMQTVTIRFKSTPAMPTLAAGSVVLVGGQKVGKVVSAMLRKEPAGAAADGATQAFFVVVTAEILRELELKKDCTVVAEGPPLGGDGVVKIALGQSAEALPAGQVIVGSDPGGFGAILSSLQEEFDAGNPTSLLGQVKAQLDPQTSGTIMARVTQSLGDVNAMTGSLRKQFNEEDRATLLSKLRDTAVNVAELTGALRQELERENPRVALGKVHKALDSLNDGLTNMTALLRTNEPRISRAMHSVEQATANVAAETDPTRADSLMTHFKLAGERLNIALADIDKATGTLRDVMVLNRENLNRMLVNFKEASDHLKTGVKYVLRHPWRVLNAPAPGEIRQINLFDAARNFTDAATRIDDATSQLKALSEMHNGRIPTDDLDLRRLQADLKQTQEMYRKAEGEFWKQLQAGS